MLAFPFPAAPVAAHHLLHFNTNLTGCTSMPSSVFTPWWNDEKGEHTISLFVWGRAKDGRLKKTIKKYLQTIHLVPSRQPKRFLEENVPLRRRRPRKARIKPLLLPLLRQPSLSTDPGSCCCDTWRAKYVPVCVFTWPRVRMCRTIFLLAHTAQHDHQCKQHSLEIARTGQCTLVKELIFNIPSTHSHTDKQPIIVPTPKEARVVQKQTKRCTQY